MEKTTLLNREIAKIYHSSFELFPSFVYYCYESARCCTKSTMNSIRALLLLLYFPKCAILALVYEHKYIHDRILQNLLSAGKILKISEKISFSVNDKRQELYINNNILIFKHTSAGDIALQGTEPPIVGHKWVMIWFYELSTFLNWTKPMIINLLATFWRSIAYYKKEKNLPVVADKNDIFAIPTCQIIFEFNAPKRGYNTEEFINSVRDWMIHTPDAHYQFNTYQDLSQEEQKKFLGLAMMKQIENTKEYFPVEWNEIYMGKSGTSTNQVYYNTNQSEHWGVFEKSHLEKVENIYIGVDVGRYDATSMVCRLTGYDKHGKLFIQDWKHWYHSNRNAVFEKYDNTHMDKHSASQIYEPYNVKQYCNLIKKFIEEVHQDFPSKKIQFQMDYAGEGAAWWDLIFGYDKNGMSLMDENVVAWIPPYLENYRNWEKANIGKRIDTHIYIFGSPNCYKCVSERLFNAFFNEKYDNGGCRIDDAKRKDIDKDSVDSAEYTFTNTDYEIIKKIIVKQL